MAGPSIESALTNRGASIMTYTLFFFLGGGGPYDDYNGIITPPNPYSNY